MPLPAPNLDDRRFQDLVDEAKRAIPRHCPEWTNHNLHDPGIALIELFAWMSEQLLFRLNQVPDRLYVHFLNLVGIDLFPPAAAHVDLTFWLSAALDHPVTVPAGTQVSTADSQGPAVVFATVEDLVLAPARLGTVLTATGGAAARTAAARTAAARAAAARTAAARTAADDRGKAAGEDVTAVNGTVEDVTGLLGCGRPVTCFRSDPLTPGDAVLLGFEESLAGAALRLTVRADAEGIGIDPRRPPLSWQAWTGEEWQQLTVHRDTTGGLNRDGEVVLLLPHRHERSVVAGVAAHWVRVVLCEPREGRPGYRRAPALSGLVAEVVGGTVVAEHAEPVAGEQVGRSDGHAGQVFRTSRHPVVARRRGEHVVVTGPDGPQPWQEVADFSASGPQDRHVVWDSGTGELRFGPAVRQPDGLIVRHGAAPPDGAQVSVTGYRVGGGKAGNVGARTLVVQRTPLPYVATVTNLHPATGGADAETVAEAKVRGPLTLRTGMRAVTASDYERLTLQSVPDVARARCLPPGGAGDRVRLLLVPRLPAPAAGHGLRDLDELALGADLVSRVGAALEPRRVIGTRVELATPYYQGVSVAALIHCGTSRSPAVVQHAAEAAITGVLDPLTGGPHGSGWPFDGDLTGAAIAQLLEGVDGVAHVEEVLLFEYDLRLRRRVGDGREVLQLEPDSLFLLAAPAVVAR